MTIIMMIVAGAVAVSPLVCIILFFYSLSELIRNKQEWEKHPERNCSEDNQKQIIRMIVTGIIGVVTGIIDVSVIVTIIRISTGEISIM